MTDGLFSQPGSQRRTKTEVIIHKHCDLIYPSGSSVHYQYDECDISDETSLENFPSISWLFDSNKSGKWPDDAKLFVWRSMHDNNAYSKDPTTDETTLLIDLLIAYLRVKCNKAQHGSGMNKVRRLTMHWTRRWINEGLLILTAGDRWRRTNEFEEILKVRERSWCHRDLGQEKVGLFHHALLL